MKKLFITLSLLLIIAVWLSVVAKKYSQEIGKKSSRDSEVENEIQRTPESFFIRSSKPLNSSTGKDVRSQEVPLNELAQTPSNNVPEEYIRATGYFAEQEENHSSPPAPLSQ